ncbi:DUF6263 family protein [Flavobacteriaceae bacterium F89]|uniref:DUF6263 family protein n=1 Tax=Cerina litoralis TaxID=2874477 RepID=A0AAE3EXF6_9FLAO|nr:DUF6263 family protein [Cerina litoralis]MCG2462018.1 DUF6263 family protein [Cerina litoralis]
MRSLVYLLFFTLCGNALLGQSLLEYNLKAGEVYTIKQKATQEITQNLEGAAHVITNYIDGILEFKVVGETDGNYNIDLTFKDLNLELISSIQGKMMEVHAKEVVEGDIQSKVFNSLLEHPVHLILARTGDILEVSGGEELVEKMTASSELEDDFSKNMMKKSLESEFGSQALANSYKQMTFIYPKKNVRVGDTWKNAYQGKMQTENTWTLDSLTNEHAVISGKANVVMDIKELSSTMNLMGTQQTTITTDLSSGFVQNMKVEGISEGTSQITQMGDQEIPTTIKSTVSYQLIK